MAKQVWLVNLVMLSVLALGTGCSNKSTKASDLGPETTATETAPPAAPETIRNDTTVEAITGGDTVDFRVSNMDRFEEYTGRALDEIENLKININFEDVDVSNVAIYNGKIKINYEEVTRDPNSGAITGRVARQGRFESSNSTDVSNQLYDSQYNKFYNGAFKAFTQDKVGSVILILDEETNDLGTWSGRVYFKNFNFDICGTKYPYFCAPQPEKWQSRIGPVRDYSRVPCWFLKSGPYQCRDYLVSDSIRPDLVDYPSEYKLLGRFDNIDIRKALNIEEE